ncbi:homeobox protein MSH-B-like [Vanessa cardui]|uniref:homeobox protein MSH-B-like n=1 Tax=Vanessa cardui TaxID=171605 RepID=UPI001F131B43|nr:homeobox protein MSH-B-like [Vanessa cardui]
MNLSPVQSSAKCASSDFSIERILSDDNKDREESQVPNWLCCSRYQPPRLPRAPNACRARRSGRHARVPFTSAQASALEAAYARAPYLAPPALRALAAALQLRDDRIKIWFQNRRARERREKTGPITPPHAVALPSTTSQSNIYSEAWNQSQDNISLVLHSQQSELSANLNISNRAYFCPSLSTSEEDSNGSRCETPIDVENILG